MLYYVRSGLIDTSLIAATHKQAAIKTLANFENFGKCVIVGTENLDEHPSSHSSQMFFFTEHLLKEVSDYNNDRMIVHKSMKLVY